jgi:hypothetical protein
MDLNSAGRFAILADPSLLFSFCKVSSRSGAPEYNKMLSSLAPFFRSGTARQKKAVKKGTVKMVSSILLLCLAMTSTALAFSPTTLQFSLRSAVLKSQEISRTSKASMKMSEDTASVHSRRSFLRLLSTGAALAIFPPRSEAQYEAKQVIRHSPEKYARGEMPYNSTYARRASIHVIIYKPS